ncbi:MAG TPA: hypothetical protein VKK31_17285 [Thermoanaerobaculia bacterium]|nr:hypothetical protein [Thermoanaerobaculia bacterium]
MDKLLEIKIGGGGVHSGWLPLSALAMVRDLLEAIAEEGTDDEIWKSIEPQIEVVGKGSTVLAVHTPFARKLRTQVKSFRSKAKRHVLGPQGRDFVKKHVATKSATWAYVTMVEVPDPQEAKATPEKERILRFDARYKELLLLKQPAAIHGFDEVYVTVVRAGGDTPTVTLNFLNGGSGTYPIRGKDRRGLAKQIASHLYDTVRLSVEVWWNSRTLEVENMHILDLLAWRDVHLAQVYRDHGNLLPIRLTVDSVEELLAEREEDRSG